MNVMDQGPEGERRSVAVGRGEERNAQRMKEPTAPPASKIERGEKLGWRRLPLVSVSIARLLHALRNTWEVTLCIKSTFTRLSERDFPLLRQAMHNIRKILSLNLVWAFSQGPRTVS